MEFKYDVPQEVTKEQYEAMMHKLSGLVAGRISEGKYFIKLMMPKYKDYVENFFKSQLN